MSIRAKGILLASLAVAGYMLAGTSASRFLRAASELLSAAPVLASLPTLGLALLWAVLALRLCATPPTSAAGTEDRPR